MYLVAPIDWLIAVATVSVQTNHYRLSKDLCTTHFYL